MSRAVASFLGKELFTKEPISCNVSSILNTSFQGRLMRPSNLFSYINHRFRIKKKNGIQYEGNIKEISLNQNSILHIFNCVFSFRFDFYRPNSISGKKTHFNFPRKK